MVDVAVVFNGLENIMYLIYNLVSEKSSQIYDLVVTELGTLLSDN